MANRLAGKVALITGAGGGIGKATAMLFAREGAVVAVNDIHSETVEVVVTSIRGEGGQALAAVADVTNSGQVREMFSSIAVQHGGIDILVNNAFAAFNDVSLVDLREEDWDRTLNVCLKGPFLCAQQAIPQMREQGGGSIVWMSSVNALFGVSEPAYTTSKGGLISLARLVAAEFGRWNIRSNVICPGTIGTETCLNYWQQFPTGFERLKEMYPMGRIGKPEEIAQCALYLASDDSSFVTGAVNVVDGGLLAGRTFETA